MCFFFVSGLYFFKLKTSNFQYQATYTAPVLKAAPLSTEFRTAAPAFAIPTTKLLPITYETKPFYRFAAPGPAIVAGNFYQATFLCF